MCSLCGILGCDDHWTNAVERRDTFTRNVDSVSRRREAARRRKIANAILSLRRIELREHDGNSYVLKDAKGRTRHFEALAHLWPEAEMLSTAGFDPLDEALLARLETLS